MKRLLTIVLAVLLLLAGLAAAGGWWGQRKAAYQVSHPGYSPQPVPSEVQQQRQQLARSVELLVEEHPNLKAVPREYLEQPLEQTQELLFTLAQMALQKKDLKRWELLVDLLNGIWLKERATEQPRAEQLAILLRYQQRVQALYAQARVLRISAALPATSGWYSGQNLAHRYLLCLRQELWKQAHLQHPLQPLTWWKLQADLGQLDRWHQQLQAGAPLEKPTSSALQGPHLAVQLANGL